MQRRTFLSLLAFLPFFRPKPAETVRSIPVDPFFDRPRAWPNASVDSVAIIDDHGNVTSEKTLHYTNRSDQDQYLSFTKDGKLFIDGELWSKRLFDEKPIWWKHYSGDDS